MFLCQHNQYDDSSFVSHEWFYYSTILIILYRPKLISWNLKLVLLDPYTVTLHIGLSLYFFNENFTYSISK